MGGERIITGALLLALAAFPAAAADQSGKLEDNEIILTEELRDSEQAAIEKMPELTEFAEAEYPAALMKMGVEGTVLLDLVVNEKGTVDSATVAKSLHAVLDSNSLLAARGLRFSPAMSAGQPVSVMLQYEYRFFLKERAKQIPAFANFTGRLLERGTRKPLADAMVVLSFRDSLSDTALGVPFGYYRRQLGNYQGQYLEEDRLVTVTDSSGNFRFFSLPACSIDVSVPLPGYLPLEESEVIAKGEAVSATYYVQNLNYSEYEVVAYGKRDKKEVSRRQLTLAEVKKIPGFGGDAIKVVQALPGVARPSFSSGAIIVRGSGNEDTRYFLDGIAIPQIYHMGGIKSTYNSDLLSSIDMYPGGFNARYGGAVGGVVEVKGRPAQSDRWHGATDINFLDASVLAEGPVSKTLSLAMAGRMSYIGPVLRKATENLPTTVVPAYWDAVARFDYKPSLNNRMFWTYFSAGDKLEIISKEVRGGSEEVGAGPNKGLMDSQFHTLIYGYDRPLGEAFRNELRLSLGYQHGNGSFFGFSRYEFTDYSLYVRDQLGYALGSWLKLNVGTDANLDTITYDLRIQSTTGFRDTRMSRIFSNMGAYSNLELQPLKGLLIIPGFRYDYLAELAEGVPTFRLTARCEYAKGHTVKASAGTYAQTPKPVGQAIDTVWGNPDLPSTKAEHFIAGYEWALTDLISLDAQAYFNHQSDIPRFAGDINPQTGRPYNFLADMEGRMYGLELMLRHDQGNRFFGWLTYSLSRSERRALGPTAPSGARTTTWDPEEWVLFGSDQTHNAQLVANWRLPKNWESGFRFRYVTGNPETPLLSFTENRFEYDADFARYIELRGDPLSDRVGPFVQLDVRADKKFVFRNWMLSAYVDVQNLNYFFYNSPEYYDYNYDNSEREAVGSVILPTIGMKASF